jgi:uncharacterized protein
MRFWDSSALVPLILVEPRSADVERLLREDEHIVTATIAPLEVTSALWRRKHQNELDAAEIHEAESLFAMISENWRSLAQTADVIDRAVDLLSRHRLRTLDALQLATALTFAGDDRSLPFVTLDSRLSTAARAEGFATLP